MKPFMQRYDRHVIPIALGLLLPHTAYSAGFKINEQSASGAGNAYAGQAAITEDASVVFYNPAGMTKLKKPEFTGGMAYINLEGKFEGEGTNRAGYDLEDEGYSQSNDFIPDVYIPFAYAARPLNDKWAMGIGVFTPFGTRSNYNDDFIGGTYADETSIVTIDIQPALAYKINDSLSVGVGIDFVQMKNRQSKHQDLIPYNENIPALSNPEYMGYENRSEFRGEGRGTGWNIGITWDIGETRTLGFAYRSEIDLTLRGEVELDNQRNVSVFQGGAVVTIPSIKDEDAKVDFTTPQSATLSYAEYITPRWRFLAGTTWTGYSSFEYYEVRSTEDDPGPAVNLANLGDGYLTHVVEKWEDDWAYAIGSDYQITHKTLLRLGFALDQSPIPNNYRIMRQPGNDRRWITTGMRHRFTSDFSMDFAAAYLIIEDTELDEKAYDLNDEEIESPSSIQGTHDVNGWGISLQVNYQI